MPTLFSSLGFRYSVSSGAQAILAPPVAVEAVGSVAAAAAMGDKSVPAGILKVDDIARLARTV